MNLTLLNHCKCKKFVFLILLLLTFLLTFDYGAYAKDQVEIKVGYIPVLDQLPVVVATENNSLTYKKCFVSLDKYRSWTALEAAFRLKRIDACILTVPIALTVASENIPMHIVGAVSRGGVRLIVKNGTEVEVLKDTIIGVPGLDTTENILLSQFLKNNSLKLGKDVRSLNVYFSSSISDFQKGNIDGLFLPEPYGSLAEDKEIGIELEVAKDISAGKLFSVLVVREETLSENREAVDEWLLSVNEAIDYINQDINTTGGKQLSIIQEKYYDLSKDLAIDIFSNNKSDLIFTKDSPTKEELQQIYNVVESMRLINSSVDIENLLTF